MSDPTIEQGGWAAEGPGSPLRRGRSVALGVLAAILLLGGIAASVAGIVMIARDAGPSDERILARGTVAAIDSRERSETRFETDEPGAATVWLALGGPDNVRESIVAGTTCTLRRAGGSGDVIEGRVQGTVVATDGYETIGQTTVGAGENVIACRHVPFGPIAAQGALHQEHDFVLERGTPGDGLSGWRLVIPGIPAALLGLFLFIRWKAGTVRPA